MQDGTPRGRWPCDRSASRRRGEKALIGKSATDHDGIAAAADATAAAIDTQSDMSADSGYRKTLIGALAREVIASAFARAKGGGK